MMNKEVFKIQTSTDKSGHLVYNESRTYFGEFPFDKKLFGLIAWKGYVFGYVNKKGKLEIEKVLKRKDFPLW